MTTENIFKTVLTNLFFKIDYNFKFIHGFQGFFKWTLRDTFI